MAVAVVMLTGPAPSPQTAQAPSLLRTAGGVPIMHTPPSPGTVLADRAEFLP